MIVSNYRRSTRVDDGSLEGTVRQSGIDADVTVDGAVGEITAIPHGDTGVWGLWGEPIRWSVVPEVLVDGLPVPLAPDVTEAEVGAAIDQAACEAVGR